MKIHKTATISVLQSGISAGDHIDITIIERRALVRALYWAVKRNPPLRRRRMLVRAVDGGGTSLTAHDITDIDVVQLTLKIVAALTVIALVVTLVVLSGCGGGGGDPEPDKTLDPVACAGGACK